MALALILPPVALGGVKENKEAMRQLMEGLTVDLPPVEALGSYSGEVRIALGAVTDDGYTETDDFLGVAPSAMLRVTLASTRLESIAEAVDGVLSSTGLRTASPETADYLLDVTILRDRFFYDRDRLRSEVILDFDFRRGQELAGHLLAYGNAEAAYAAPEFTEISKVHPVYEGAFQDALYKLVESDTFTRLVGDGWTAGSPPPGVDGDVHRIDKDVFYIPTERPPELDEWAAVFAGRDYDRLIFQDFEILDKEFLKKAKKLERKASGEGSKVGKVTKKALKISPLGKVGKAIARKGKKDTDKSPEPGEGEGAPETVGLEEPSEPATKKEARRARAARIGTTAEQAMAAGIEPTRLACECLPGLIREHVQAFYPGAFSSVERRQAWEPADGLVVTGHIHRFNMGTGKSRLEVDIFLKDGLSGEILHTIPLEMGGGMGWMKTTFSILLFFGAGAAGSPLLPITIWTAPEMRDMEDDIARAVAYTLVATLRPDYEPPPDLEIAFDEWSRAATSVPTGGSVDQIEERDEALEETSG